MTIATGSILKDGVIGLTGGTAAPFSSLGSSEGTHKVYFDGTDILSRSSADFSVKVPRVKSDAPNGYTQARNKVVLRVPLVLDNGNHTVNTVSIEMSSDIEMTSAEKDTMRGLAAQLLSDADFDDFWDGQSVA